MSTVCFRKVRDAYPEFDKDLAKRIDDRIENKIKGLTPDEMEAMLKEMATEERYKLIEKRNSKMRIVHTAIEAVNRDYRNTMFTNAGEEALVNTATDTGSVVGGAFRNSDNLQKMKQGELERSFDSHFEGKEELLSRYYKTTDFDEDIALVGMGQKARTPDGQFVADALKKSYKDMYWMKIDSGHMFTPIEGYMGIQQYGVENVHLNKDKFVDWFMDNSNIHEILPHGTNVEKRSVLLRVRNDILAGSKRSSDTIFVKGKARIFKFNDAQATMEFRDLFGNGKSYAEAHDVAMRKVSTDSAQTEIYGLDPVRGLNDVADIINESNAMKTDGSGPGPHIDGEQIHKVKKILLHQSGKMDEAGYKDTKFYKATTISKNVMGMAALGKAQMSQLMDIVSVALKNSSATGEGFIPTYLRGLKQYAESFGKMYGKDSLKEMSQAVGVSLREEMRQLAGIYGIETSSAGGGSAWRALGKGEFVEASSIGMQKFMKWNQVTKMSQVGKHSAVSHAQSHLEQLLQRAPRNAAEKNLLTRIGLEPEELAYVKNKVKSKDRLNFLDFDEDIPARPQKFEGMVIPERARSIAERAKQKLNLYFIHNHTTGAPGESLRLKFDIGTLGPKGRPTASTFWQALWMYRTPVFGVFKNTAEAIRLRNPSNKIEWASADGMWFMGTLAAMATMHGMAINTFKDIVEGTAALGDYSKLDKGLDENIQSIMLKGFSATGIMGPIGEAFAGTLTNRGNSPLIGFMGPVASKANRFLLGYKKFAEGTYSPKDNLFGGLESARGLMPYQNSMFGVYFWNSYENALKEMGKGYR